MKPLPLYHWRTYSLKLMSITLVITYHLPVPRTSITFYWMTPLTNRSSRWRCRGNHRSIPPCWRETVGLVPTIPTLRSMLIVIREWYRVKLVRCWLHRTISPLVKKKSYVIAVSPNPSLLPHPQTRPKQHPIKLGWPHPHLVSPTDIFLIPFSRRG
jgi:hypothetical protein